MSENLFANAYRKIHINHESFMGDPVCDEKMMMQEQKKHENALAIEAYNTSLMENAEKKNRQNDIWTASTKHALLESAKNSAINKLAKELPDYLLGEAFADIYTRALPHNRQYVLEHNGQFNQLAHMYINKIGGFNHLVKVAATTESSFLKQLTGYIQEATKKALVNKTNKVAKALTEDEVKDMINPMIDQDEKNELLTKIDSLGADELAELVNQKIIDVVNDERRKIKSDTEFKNLLKSELDSNIRMDDSKASDSEEITDKTEFASEDNEKNVYKKSKKDANKIEFKTDSDDLKDTDDTKSSKKDKGKDKESNTTMEMSFMEAFQKWDPVQGTFDYNPNNERRSLFTSMMENVMTGFILESTGSAKRRRPSKVLYESPLNMVAIEDMLNKNTDEVAESSSETTDIPKPHVDKSRILSEVLTQYALIETAHTMKLINVSPIDVARQCEFLTTEYA